MEQKIKAELRIATETYCYIQPTVEGTPEDIVEMYKHFMNLVKGGTGLEKKDFDRVLDRYLTEQTMEVAEYEAMSMAQQEIVQIIKRSRNRIKNK